MADKTKYATFLLSGILFGIPAVNIQEVLELQTIVRVPLSRSTFPGMINLRGQILPVINLHEYLQLADSDGPQAAEKQMAVVRMPDGLLTFLIDRVGAILDVDSSSYEEPSETFKASIREVVKHMCKLDRQILLVLDLDRLARCLTAVSSVAS
jgi:chemotaxis signal transduction protein